MLNNTHCSWNAQKYIFGFVRTQWIFDVSIKWWTISGQKLNFDSKFGSSCKSGCLNTHTIKRLALRQVICVYVLSLLLSIKPVFPKFFLLMDLFWLWKITTDRHILCYINIVSGWQVPKIKNVCLGTDFRMPRTRTSSICNNAVWEFVLMKLLLVLRVHGVS